MITSTHMHFKKKIVENTPCIKMLKYKGNILDRDIVYGFLENLSDKPSNEVTKILNNTEVLSIFKGVGET